MRRWSPLLPVAAILVIAAVAILDVQRGDQPRETTKTASAPQVATQETVVWSVHGATVQLSEDGSLCHRLRLAGGTAPTMAIRTERRIAHFFVICLFLYNHVLLLCILIFQFYI